MNAVLAAAGIAGASGAVSRSRRFEVAPQSSPVVDAQLRSIDGRDVAWFTVAGGARAGALGPAECRAVIRLVDHAVRVGVPIVGVLATAGADIHAGIDALHAWGTLARRLAAASGSVPIVFGVTGPCLSGPALLLGLADHVVMTPESYAFVSGPGAVREMTGVVTNPAGLGGAGVHARTTGLASLVVGEADVPAAIAELLAYLPGNHLDDAAPFATADPAERLCPRAAAAVPADPRASYDVRVVVADVLDADSFLETRAGWAPNMVTGYGSLAGRPVGVVANQPLERAGTIDIAAASKAARFVQHCDAFNVPLITFVDTPGFEPGRDLEWRGMIRHGAELVYAYGQATVPRLCVIIRKAYGGAYIVMDSRTLGNDACFAWTGSEIAVMGAPGAVAVLHGRELAAITDEGRRSARRRELETQYTASAANPRFAAEQGLVDDVIEPHETRAVLAGALHALRSKCEHQPARRKHGNSPL